MEFTEDEQRAFVEFGLKPEDLGMKNFLKVAKERFRLFALDIHPDKNPSPNATQQYQVMQARYQLLLEVYERQATSGIPSSVPTTSTGSASMTKTFTSFGRSCYAEDSDEEGSPNTSYCLPEGGVRDPWGDVLLTVEVQGTSFKYQEALPLCKWRFYAPVVVGTFFAQLVGQGIPQTAALKVASENVTLVTLTGSSLSKPMFLHSLFTTIREFENRKYPSQSIMDRYYSITYHGTKEFSVGWIKFLLAVGLPDRHLYHAICGSDSRYGLRADAADVYKEFLWHCLVNKRVDAFRQVVSRLLLSVPLNEAQLPFFLELASTRNRFQWWLKWRDTVRKEELYAKERVRKTDTVMCAFGNHEITASEACFHLEEEHKEGMVAGWVACENDSRCIHYIHNRKRRHELCCPYRTRPLLDCLENSVMRRPETEPKDSIPLKFRRAI